MSESLPPNKPKRPWKRWTRHWQKTEIVWPCPQVDPLWQRRISITMMPDYLLHKPKPGAVDLRPASLADFSLQQLQYIIQHVISHRFETRFNFVFPQGRFYVEVYSPDEQPGDDEDEPDEDEKN